MAGLRVIHVLFVNSGAPSGRGVHSASNGFTQASLSVLGFIWVRFGSIGCEKCSSVSFSFARVYL